MKFRHFPVEYQMDSQDCGPASLKIIAKHFGKYYSLQFLRDKCCMTREGVSLLDLSAGAESIGLRTLSIKCTIEDGRFNGSRADGGFQRFRSTERGKT